MGLSAVMFACIFFKMCRVYPFLNDSMSRYFDVATTVVGPA